MDDFEYSIISKRENDEKENFHGATESSSVSPLCLWVFGYGSLIWKPDFHYEEKVIGYLKGYKRRFWLGNTDHRGMPGSPARVATLIQQAQEETWGIAYKVSPSDVPEVMSYLNHRETGYTTHKVVFYPHKDSHIVSPFHTLVYIGTELSPHYLGPAPIEDIATQVVNARGRNGCNSEYVLKLAESMRALLPSVYDSHLFNLEDKIREILKHRSQMKRILDVNLEVTTTNLKEGSADCPCNFCNCSMSSLSILSNQRFQSV